MLRRAVTGLLLLASAWLEPAQAQQFCGNYNFPCWTTSGRPSTPGVGTTGYNITTGNVEWWNGTTWTFTVVASPTNSIQFNNSGVLGGSANLLWDGTGINVGVSGVLGYITFGNASSGTVKVQPVTGALGTVTASLPANTGTIAELNLAQTFTAVQTVTNGDLALLGTSTGKTTLNSGLTGASNNTLTLPTTSSDTLAGLGTTQTFTAVQTFTNSDIALLGSSTGATTFTSANASASNFTLTFPAITATVTTTIASGTAALNTTIVNSGACSSTQTFTATGAASTDAIQLSFNSDPTGTTGYAPSTNGGLFIVPWLSSNTLNIKVCNDTGANITPGGTITLNFRVVR